MKQYSQELAVNIFNTKRNKVNIIEKLQKLLKKNSEFLIEAEKIENFMNESKIYLVEEITYLL